MKTYVLGFAFNLDRTQVALIEKRRPAWQKGKLNGLGGKIEAGELPQEAMAREFREEAGVATRESDWQLFAVMSGPDFLVYVLHTVLDDGAFPQLKTCTDEMVLVVPVDNPVLKKYAISNIPWLLGAALDPDAGRMILRAEYGQSGQDLGAELLAALTPEEV